MSDQVETRTTYEWFNVTDHSTICSVTTGEIITSVTLTLITGESQQIDSSPVYRDPPSCPIQGTGYNEFTYVPVSQQASK
jgi:hypothetical protein